MFQIRKIAGARRWIGQVSNNARDRDRDIVSKTALEEVVAREKAAGNYPELQFYHINYGVGVADYYAVVDGVLFATGIFNESDPVAKAFADYLEAHPESTDGSGWGMSWRFYAKRGPDRVFKHVDSIVEFTFLPLSRAANEFTQFGTEIIKMTLTPEQRQMIEKVIGDPAMLATIEAAIAARQTSKALDEAGVQRKDAAEVPADAVPATEAAPDAQAKAADMPDDGKDGGKGGGKCNKCGHAMHSGKCDVAGCDCMGAQKKEVEAAPADPLEVLKAKPLTYGDLDSVNEYIDSRVEEARKSYEAKLDAIVNAVNDNLKKLATVVTGLHEEVAEAREEVKAAEEALLPRSAGDYLKMRRAAASSATAVGKDDPLAKSAPAETLDVASVFAQVGLAE